MKLFEVKLDKNEVTGTAMLMGYYSGAAELMKLLKFSMQCLEPVASCNTGFLSFGYTAL